MNPFFSPIFIRFTRFNKVLRVLSYKKLLFRKESRILISRIYIFYANSLVLFLNFSADLFHPEFSLYNISFLVLLLSNKNFSLHPFYFPPPPPNFYILISRSSIKFFHIYSLPFVFQSKLFIFVLLAFRSFFISFSSVLIFPTFHCNLSLSYF